MADTFQFELVAPERRLVSTKAHAVQIPGADGDLTAMANHAPLITTLRPGVLSISGPDGDAAFLVTGGFAEITATEASVLAERALPVEEVGADIIDQLVSEAQKAAEAAPPEAKDAADKLVADYQALRSSIGA